MEAFINTLKSFENKQVILKGWIYNKRSSGSIIFLQFRDGTGFVQAVVIKDEVGKKVFKKAGSVTLETSAVITGKVKKEKRAPSGYEIVLEDIDIVQYADEYPIGKKSHGPDFLLTHRHLWLRSKSQWAIQRIRNAIIYAIYEHLKSEGFIKIDAPILTPNACEGTTTLFPVPYAPAWKDKGSESMNVSIDQSDNTSDNKPFAFLSQSGQLYIEAAIMSHGRVFDFGPTFRAEKSKTRRHLSEFWMMDAEMAYVRHKENMKFQERLIVSIVKKVIEECAHELKILKRDISKLRKVLQGDFPIIAHEDAIKILKKNKMKIGERDDFGAEAEAFLSEKYDKPLFIERYPKEIKAFYMKEDPTDNSRVLNNDLLAPEGYGEIIGGSEREDNYKILKKKILDHSLSLDDYDWYLDLRKYGSVPHSGYGLGLERLVAWVSGISHVRESIPFPRMLERFKP